MLEGQVAFYLNKYLGNYVYGLDPQSLKISVFKGDVQLNNLHLKPEALNALNLPITVKAGLLGSLTLKVRPLLSAHKLQHCVFISPHVSATVTLPASNAELLVTYRYHGPA